MKKSCIPAVRCESSVEIPLVERAEFSTLFRTSHGISGCEPILAKLKELGHLSVLSVHKRTNET